LKNAITVATRVERQLESLRARQHGCETQVTQCDLHKVGENNPWSQHHFQINP